MKSEVFYFTIVFRVSGKDKSCQKPRKGLQTNTVYQGMVIEYLIDTPDGWVLAPLYGPS